MGKPKKATQPSNPLKDSVKSIKEGQVKKHKVQKFKKTPSGKVPLINSNGKANGNSKPQKNNKPIIKEHQSPSPNKNKNKKKSPKGASPQEQPQKKKNAELKKKQEPEDDSDSDEDINEGISLAEDVSNLEDDSDDSSEEEETPNILGESLANSSDEDDEDFEGSDDDDDEEEEEEEVKKGVKKFKGSKQISPKESSEDDDDDDEDEDDDDDEEEENADKSVVSSQNSSLNSSAATDDSDEDDDDDEEDEEDDDDDDDDGPGLKALLGDSLVDQEDDEDFDGEAEEDEDDEDEDMSEDDENEESQDEKKVSNDSSRFVPTEGNPRLSDAEKAEQDTRTIFVGNVPKDLEEKALKQTFKKFGEIQNFRIRGCIPEDPKMKLKVAQIKKKFHPLSKTLCVYVVYKSKESVDKALTFNGQKLGGNYIRVDRIGQERQADPKKSVFLGNVPWDIEDNELWDIFSKCGKIDYVRTIRDRNTGCCRGIAYINFAEADGATLALDLDGTKIRKRDVRVNRYDPNRPKKSSDKAGKKRKNSGKLQETSPKKQKTEVERATENSLNAQKRKAKKPKGSPKAGGGFQGQKAEGKKKGAKKGNKFDKKKKNIAAKLLAPKKFKGSQ